MTTRKDWNKNITTLINVFTVESSEQEKLVYMLIGYAEQVLSKQEGFISANVNKSLDGTRVANYTQWKSRDAIEKMLNNPKAQIHMNDMLSIATSMDGNLYEVVFTDEKV